MDFKRAVKIFTLAEEDLLHLEIRSFKDFALKTLALLTLTGERIGDLFDPYVSYEPSPYVGDNSMFVYQAAKPIRIKPIIGNVESILGVIDEIRDWQLNVFNCKVQSITKTLCREASFLLGEVVTLGDLREVYALLVGCE